MRWNSKRGGKDLLWNQCIVEKEGPLVLAARSGSLDLVSHLLSLAETDTTGAYSDSNAPIKVVQAAIRAGSEQMVLYVLRHERFKGKIEYEEVCFTDPEDSDYDDFGYGDDGGAKELSYTVAGCVREAYHRNMFHAVCELCSIDDYSYGAATQVWLCWRARTQAELGSSTHLHQDEPQEPHARIEAMARKQQGNLVFKHNSKLLPILIARSRYSISTVIPVKGFASFVTQCDEDVFRCIANYCFIINPDMLQKEVEEDIHFQENAEWCCECEGYFLPFTCFCGTYCGYSS